jgi:predicted branched-subunit amino acid permease
MVFAFPTVFLLLWVIDSLVGSPSLPHLWALKGLLLLLLALFLFFLMVDSYEFSMSSCILNDCALAFASLSLVFFIFNSIS